MYSVNPGASLTIFGTGLGVTPLILAYRPDLKEFLDPFLKEEGAGEPLASLVFSEPGGVVSFFFLSFCAIFFFVGGVFCMGKE